MFNTKNLDEARHNMKSFADNTLVAFVHPSLIRPEYRKRCLTWEQKEENIRKRLCAEYIKKHFIVND